MAEWLREQNERPFFAWVHFLSPHAPYDLREGSAHLYDPAYVGRFQTTSGAHFDTKSPAEIQRLRSLYDGEVLHGDARFGGLMEVLEETGLAARTIVVLTSDHGEEFAEHGEFQHDRLTEEHVRIPLIVRAPAHRGARVENAATSNVDLFPTLLAMAGLATGGDLDGHDLTEDRNRRASDVVGVSMTGSDRRWLSHRSASIKLIRQCLPTETDRLFDLSTDPGEKLDLAAEHPELVGDLAKRLALALGGPPCAVMQSAVRSAKPTRGLSEERVDALKALGYIEDA